ncbi:MAG: hypothetical protein JO171_15210 [Paludibacterium sp.]|uniref:hypothetical protein n=1 Tax=Paludibacterium sp. TaxID=1917523 RepID=UPI0025FEBA88|nr:hypothetical protein [Paludibacterium sp.]MBV8048501.1 hypothetical protein [Paludibacterium sp.]MBV8647361.1 hypothetical protein [Paludibacterium sp.]
MNTPSAEHAAPQVAEATEVKAPESETALANIAMPLGESILKIQRENGLLMYGILQRNRAVTGQSDFFRVQFRGYALNTSGSWSSFAEDEARFHGSRNCAWARVDHPSRAITFGPKAGLNITDTLAGTGLDDFLFSIVVAWAKATYGDYSASPGMLMIQAGTSETEKLHKQAFFAKQGFEFEWRDEQQRSGIYYKDKVGRLIGVCESAMITEFGGESMLQTLIKQDQDRHEMQQHLSKIESMNNAVHQALDKERHTTQALAIALGVVILMGLWAVL